MRKLVAIALVAALGTGCFSVAGTVLGNRRSKFEHGRIRTYAFEGLEVGAALDLVLLAALSIALGGAGGAPPQLGDCPAFDPRPCD